ncbi:unnamed protein product [Cladocopium goreaui]|uniref:Uncharacterized protein n=1 Tax=Cladocopium goreaui TaxID=2562237 RepID=A0A9P1FDU9_9DINO|nr:unnamed protein product [Cladocopium goreaui]
MASKRSASASCLRLAAISCFLVGAFQNLTLSIPKQIEESAQNKGISPAQYLKDVSNRAELHRKSDAVAGREEFVKTLNEAMGKSGLHLVIGGKSLGKTKIVQTVVDNAGDEAPLLYVNMRLRSKAQSTDALECLQEEAKRRWTAKNLPFGAERLVAAGSAVLGALGKANLKKSDDEEIGEGAVETLLSLFLNITKPEEFIKAFVAATMAAEKVPVMIVDEANIAFPNGNGGNGNGRREAAYRALATFVALTKEQGKASVILVASDYAFPLGLQALGFNKYDALNTIVAPEVEEKPMLFLLQEWGLSQDLAQEFYETFGGNVFLCHQAVDKLRQQFELGQERLFDPFNVRDNAELGDLVRDPLTRKHMENLAQKGWSQVEGGAAEAETESQKGARIIAKKNFGAIIERQTTTFFDKGLDKDMFRDPDAVRVLIPPTTYARKCIQRMVDTVKPSITRPQAGAVWVRQLKEDRSDRCQSVAPPRKHYCIGFYDLNNHVYANSAANYMVMVLM